MGYLFKNIYLVTMDDEQPEIFKGNLLVEGRYIVKVSAEEIEAEGHQVVEGQNRLLMPGFINTHTHAGMTLFRGYGDDLPLFNWLNDMIWPAEEKLTPEDIYRGSKLAVAEMLLSGTTSFLDMYMEMDQVAAVVKETGIRGFLSRGTTSGDEKKAIEELRAFIETYHNTADGRLQVLMGPHAIYTNRGEFLREQGEMARDYNIGVHIHVAETRKEVADCLEANGKGPFPYLDSLGLFDVPYVVAAHCVITDAADLAIMKEKNIGVAHNPQSNLKLASGIAPIKDYLEAGLSVGIGTDGASSNNNLDMLEELQYASFVQKGFNEDPLALKAYEALYCATAGGAKVLNVQDRIGCLKEGYEADLIMFDLNKPHFYPLSNNIISHLAYSAKSSDIVMTMVQGEVLMKDGQLVTIDLESLYQQVEESAKRLMN